MGWLDWLLGKDEAPPAAGTARAAKASDPSAAPCTDTQGATVVAGQGEHGAYDIDDAVLAGGGQAVLDFVLADDLLEEVMHNGSDRPLVVFHRSHGMCDVNYRLEPHVVDRFIGRVAQRVGKVVDAQHPFLDGSLEDGSRVNASIPPFSGDWPNFTIRKFRKNVITVPELIRFGALSPEAAAFLWVAIEGLGRHAANVLVVGGTGSGKTTLLNALAWFAPRHHRIVLIEDTRELRVPHPNTLQMASGNGVTMNDLLVNALRQRPDRILVGEVRGPEAATLFTAMNTGHDGCMGTLHANSARESMMRITSSPMSVPLMQVNALDLVVVQQRKQTDSGTRRFCSEITEVSGVGGDTARLNQLFAWNEFKKELSDTEVPSRLRTKICQAAGINAKQFNDILARRQAILSDLAKNKATPEDVAHALQVESARPLR